MFLPQSVGNVYSRGCWPTLGSVVPFVYLQSGTGMHTHTRMCTDEWSQTQALALFLLTHMPSLTCYNHNIHAEKCTQTHIPCQLRALAIESTSRQPFLSLLYVGVRPAVWHFALAWRKWGIFLDKHHSSEMKEGRKKESQWEDAAQAAMGMCGCVGGGVTSPLLVCVCVCAYGLTCFCVDA